jgi:hypothetical protein
VAPDDEDARARNFFDEGFNSGIGAEVGSESTNGFGIRLFGDFLDGGVYAFRGSAVHDHFGALRCESGSDGEPMPAVEPVTIASLP